MQAFNDLGCTERRSFARFPLRLLGAAHVEDSAENSRQVFVQNIGGGGAYLESAEYHPAVGVSLNLFFSWPPFSTLKASARILRVSGFEGCWGFAACFQNLRLNEEGHDSDEAASTSGNSNVPPILEKRAWKQEAFGYFCSLSRAHDFILENLAQKVTLGEVAQIAGMRPSYFSSFFKNKVGLSFKVYIRQVRVEEAMKLMALRNYSISEVGARVGYPHLRSFERAFKVCSGMRPIDFKKMVAP